MTALSRITVACRSLSGRLLNRLLGRVGCRIVELSAEPQYEDIGRSYVDSPSTYPNFHLKPGTPKPVAGAPTIFTINNGSETIQEEVLWSHLTLLKLLKHFDFETVLDIGSHAQHVTRIFRHLGKKVTTVEVAPFWDADHKKDYLDIAFSTKFDAIWCSHTLEHQRNVGQFLDKMFDDLREGGVLALTVPYDLGTNLSFGHCNCFSPLVLLYHLVLAGFDCSRASVKCYNYNIGIILTKRYNGITRPASLAMVPNTPDKDKVENLDGRLIKMRDIIGRQTIFDNMASSFPLPITSDQILWNNRSLNWGNPI